MRFQWKCFIGLIIPEHQVRSRQANTTVVTTGTQTHPLPRAPTAEVCAGPFLYPDALGDPDPPPKGKSEPPRIARSSPATLKSNDQERRVGRGSEMCVNEGADAWGAGPRSPAQQRRTQRGAAPEADPDRRGHGEKGRPLAPGERGPRQHPAGKAAPRSASLSDTERSLFGKRQHLAVLFSNKKAPK